MLQHLRERPATHGRARRFNRRRSRGHTFHANGATSVPPATGHGPTLPHLIVTGRNPGLNAYTHTATGGTCAPSCHGTETYNVNY
jgi:hypothetical protein